jgi:hypothetical protein
VGAGSGVGCAPNASSQQQQKEDEDEDSSSSSSDDEETAKVINNTTVLYSVSQCCRSGSAGVHNFLRIRIRNSRVSDPDPGPYPKRNVNINKNPGVYRVVQKSVDKTKYFCIKPNHLFNDEFLALKEVGSSCFTFVPAIYLMQPTPVAMVNPRRRRKLRPPP